VSGARVELGQGKTPEDCTVDGGRHHGLYAQREAMAARGAGLCPHPMGRGGSGGSDRVARCGRGGTMEEAARWDRGWGGGVEGERRERRRGDDRGGGSEGAAAESERDGAVIGREGEGGREGSAGARVRAGGGGGAAAARGRAEGGWDARTQRR
jgi:hypothetical protein